MNDRIKTASPVKKTAAFALAAVLAAGLGACRDEEQGRILPVQDQEYRGPADPPLDDAEINQLEERARLQSY